MNSSLQKWLRAASMGIALAVLGACSTGVGNPPVTGPAPASAADAYAHSLYQSAMYEARHVLPLLPAVADAEGMVNVVSLKSAPWTVGDTTLTADVWVTVTPEVRDSCDDWVQAEQEMRLRQLLGLQPTQPVAYFMEMRVPADSMFRPTANPAIGTPTLCDTTVNPDCAIQFSPNVNPRHVQWMAQQMLASWKMPNGYPASGDGEWQRLGYPWTRLGYTYNWHPGSPRYGASEYVVRPGTRVAVTKVSTIAEYCRRG
ncbi:hypothetical protein [Longimicrobium sp.]|uniref:hypothetical protein n=1 Tax=Longimicrobium sp. TaxID=2029185 RepID=UPI003B3B2BE9